MRFEPRAVSFIFHHQSFTGRQSTEELRLTSYVLDTCMTSIFSCSWMCRLCGREACAECFEQVKELTIDKPDASEADIAELQARREKHAHINPFFLSCTRRNEHRAMDFSPMTRFSKSELSQAIADMEADGAEKDEDTPPEGDATDSTLGELVDPSASAEHKEPTSGGDSSIGFTGDGSVDISSFSSAVPAPPLPSTNHQTPSHPTRYFSDGELTEDVFRRVWHKGDPLVVTGIMDKFKVQWTPEYFRTKYGQQSCLILECQTDTNKRVTVGDFFSWFGGYPGRRECWKLKVRIVYPPGIDFRLTSMVATQDWPPSADFKTAFPELYEDFSQATPVANYVRRDGVMNIASHFPSNTVAPDLGQCVICRRCAVG